MVKKVLIYGGSGGIGSATARIQRGRGYDHHLVGRNEDRLTGIAAEPGATCTVGAQHKVPGSEIPEFSGA